MYMTSFPKFEIACPDSTRCQCVWADRPAMLVQCASMHARTGHSSTKYNLKYNLFGLGSLIDILCRFAKVNMTIDYQ